jgi:hypothetical protein
MPLGKGRGRVTVLTSKYRVVIDGEVDSWCASAFAPADVAIGGGHTTITTGEIDQPALHAIISRLAELRLTLLAVTFIAPGD